MFLGKTFYSHSASHLLLGGERHCEMSCPRTQHNDQSFTSTQTQSLDPKSNISSSISLTFRSTSGIFFIFETQIIVGQPDKMLWGNLLYDGLVSYPRGIATMMSTIQYVHATEIIRCWPDIKTNYAKKILFCVCLFVLFFVIYYLVFLYMYIMFLLYIFCLLTLSK